MSLILGCVKEFALSPLGYWLRANLFSHMNLVKVYELELPSV